MAAENRAQLTWNANTEPDLASYGLYARFATGLYTIIISVSGVTSFTMGGGGPGGTFTADGKWYFAITALDTSSNESAKSAEVSKRIIRTPMQFITRR